eukprot:RCo047848
MASLVEWYSEETVSHPLATKALTCSFIYSLGDVAVQLLDRRKRFDWTRLLAVALYALFVIGPVSHYWYELLELGVTQFLGAAGWQAVGLKIALDQFLYTPIFTVIFFTYMALAHGLTCGDAIRVAFARLLPTLKVNWVVWPPVHVITFGFIPLDFRVLFISVMAFFWACFLSYAASRLHMEELDVMEEFEEALE